MNYLDATNIQSITDNDDNLVIDDLSQSGVGQILENLVGLPDDAVGRSIVVKASPGFNQVHVLTTPVNDRGELICNDNSNATQTFYSAASTAI